MINLKDHPNRDEAVAKLFADLFPDIESRRAFAEKYRQQHSKTEDQPFDHCRTKSDLEKAKRIYSGAFRHGQIDMLNRVIRILTKNPILPLTKQGSELYKQFEEEKQHDL